MSREFFKTAILNILVFLSLILAFNIWFDKELWSDGYSSFVYSFENIFPFLSDDVYIDNSAISEESKFGMEWISVTANGKRSLIYFGDGDFSSFKSEIDGIKSSVTKSGTVSEVTQEDFTNVFKSSSIALKFNLPVSLMEYFDRDSTYFDSISPETDLILLTFSEDSSTIRYLYFADKKTEVAYRMPVKYNNGNLASLINLRATTALSSDSYAFELNFDKSAEGIDRILFDSFVPITTATKSLYTPKVRNFSYNEQNSFDAVFEAFDIKKNSARSYKDNDNVLNYIESYSTLKIKQDGSFVFSTDNYSKGVHIGKNNVVGDVLNFANSLYRNIVNSQGSLVLKDIKEKENGETVYGLIYTDGNVHLYLDGIYGAEVTVREGYISEYSQKVLALEKSTDAVFTGSVIEAYDRLYKTDLQKGKENLRIKKILPVNYYNGKETELKWYIEFSDGSLELL